jgi:ketosteroid isomerase-like protein
MGRFLVARANLLIVVIAILGSAPVLLAQKTTDSHAKDRAALIQAGQAYLAALERGDAKAIAEFWTTDGSYIDENGQKFRVRDLFATTGTTKEAGRPHTQVSDVTLRFIAADVAVEDGACEIPSAVNALPLKGRFTALWVRQNGNWKLENLREWRRSESVV